VSCRWLRWQSQAGHPQELEPAHVTLHTLQELMTQEDAAFLHSAGIEYLWEPHVRISSDPNEPLLNFE
jgi:hypothetical protein